MEQWQGSINGLTPVGVVKSEWRSTDSIPVSSHASIIEISADFVPAMHRMTEHSHFWVLSWFHKADRSIVKTRPTRVNSDLPEYGVFGLRNPSRPNPIGLSLVKLEKLEENLLTVTGLDAIDGTPVLDIKPYFESDIIFSPKTPHIFSKNPVMREANLKKQALAHHGEDCAGIKVGVKMALLAERYFGQIQAPDLKLAVSGDACIADVLQGLTRARLANPPRFSYQAQATGSEVRWQKGDHCVIMTARSEHEIRIFDEETGQSMLEAVSL